MQLTILGAWGGAIHPANLTYSKLFPYNLLVLEKMWGENTIYARLSYNM